MSSSPHALTSRGHLDAFDSDRGGTVTWQPGHRYTRDQVTGALEQLSAMLHKADLHGAKPVRSELIYLLVYLLVSLGMQFTAEAPDEPWETYYARQLMRHFRPSGSLGRTERRGAGAAFYICRVYTKLRQKQSSDPRRVHSSAGYRSLGHRVYRHPVVTVWLHACGSGSVAGAD